ncbi:MAG: YggS family pyridoxal phosphate-dependent enzyme [Anaerolineae bacterium]|nr:YggS family pyridoxal phosphate-dependent enzyme [Anaerolineae bacterium]
MVEIADSARHILDEVPQGVIVVAAAKTRTPEEVRAAVEAGIVHVGHNYVQETQAMINQVRGVTWHMIGHMQRNKARAAVELFDMIETVDSLRLAQEIDKRCAFLGKTMPVLIEVNSGREPNKDGVWPEQADDLARQIAGLTCIRLQGLMTMGPFSEDAKDLRPCFRATRKAFERLARLGLPGAEMCYLSMGMSSSYRAAIDEGANIVRIGTRLFGPRMSGQ